jgi:hypothetical protein
MLQMSLCDAKNVTDDMIAITEKTKGVFCVAADYASLGSGKTSTHIWAYATEKSRDRKIEEIQNYNVMHANPYFNLRTYEYMRGPERPV